MNKDNYIPNFGDGLKKNPFSTPGGYFEQLPSRIQEQCATPEPKKKGWVKTFLPQLGFVAGFAVLVLMAKGFFSIIGQAPEQPKGDIAQHIEDTTTSYNEYNEEELRFDDENEVTDDAIISYLVDNNVNDLDIVQ